MLTARGGGGGMNELIDGRARDDFVLLCTINMDKRMREWYMVGLDDSLSNETVINPRLSVSDSDSDSDDEHVSLSDAVFFKPTLSENSLPGCCWATVGSTLYVVGGAINPTEFSRQVFMFDVNNPTDGFVEAPDMIEARAWPAAVPLDGKLFVFDGFDDNHYDHWGEFFDTAFNEWKPMTPPPFELPCRLQLFAIPYDHNHFMLGFGGESVYLYDVDRHKWETLAHQIYPNFGGANDHHIVKVGNVVYWLLGRLYAYDLETKQNYSGRVKGCILERKTERYAEDRYFYATPLFHCGGGKNEFCFFWHKIVGERLHESSVIRRERFTVVLKSRGRLSAQVISSQSYTSNQYLNLIDALPLNFCSPSQAL